MAALVDLVESSGAARPVVGLHVTGDPGEVVVKEPGAEEAFRSRGRPIRVWRGWGRSLDGVEVTWQGSVQFGFESEDGSMTWTDPLEGGD